MDWKWPVDNHGYGHCTCVFRGKKGTYTPPPPNVLHSEHALFQIVPFALPFLLINTFFYLSLLSYCSLVCDLHFTSPVWKAL